MPALLHKPFQIRKLRTLNHSEIYAANFHLNWENDVKFEIT